MSEAMTVETIVEAEWQMKGFWTKLRYPLRTPKGSWSDIDILGYQPETRVLVIAESKVRGPKKAIYAYTAGTQKLYKSILKYDGDDYFSFLRHIRLACKDGMIFNDFAKMVKTLVVQLVSNYVITDDIKLAAETTVFERVRKDVPAGTRLEIMLDSTLDVISRIIKAENENVQGRRYGHPVMDIARELNRYMRPHIHYAGRDKVALDQIKSELSIKLTKALGTYK